MELFENDFLGSITFKKVVDDVEYLIRNKKRPKATISVEELEQAFNMNFYKKIE